MGTRVVAAAHLPPLFPPSLASPVLVAYVTVLHSLQNFEHYSEYLNSGLLSPIFSNTAEPYTSFASSSVMFSYFLLWRQYKYSTVSAATMPETANAKEEPNPVGYFGFSLSRKM